MCLIAIAHRVSNAYPLVIAANRGEDLERSTLPAQWWADAPDVLGGRDAVHGGSWLAATRSGRFAAVTNLRGAVPMNTEATASRSRNRARSSTVVFATMDQSVLIEAELRARRSRAHARARRSRPSRVTATRSSCRSALRDRRP